MATEQNSAVRVPWTVEIQVTHTYAVTMWTAPGETVNVHAAELVVDGELPGAVLLGRSPATAVAVRHGVGEAQAS